MSALLYSVFSFLHKTQKRVCVCEYLGPTHSEYALVGAVARSVLGSFGLGRVLVRRGLVRTGLVLGAALFGVGLGVISGVGLGVVSGVACV